MAMPDFTDLDPNAASDGKVIPTVKTLRRHPFRLRHHPRAWELANVDGVEYILPQIKPLWLEPGCGLVRMKQKDMQPGEQYDQALSHSEREGYTTLDHTVPLPAACLPKGVPAGPYIRAIEARDLGTGQRGTHYFERFNVPVESLPDEAQRFEFARTEYDRWRLHLVTSGQIKQPLPHVIAEMQRRLGERVSRAAATMWPTDHLRKERVEAAEKTAARVAEAAKNIQKGKGKAQPAAGAA